MFTASQFTGTRLHAAQTAGRRRSTARHNLTPRIQAAYRAEPNPGEDAFVASARSIIDAALFGPRAVAGAALSLTGSDGSSPVQRTPQNLQELSEAALLYAERGAQAEYDAFQAISALVPPQVADAIPPQLRQLAPRAPPQPSVIDVRPYSPTPESAAVLAAANSPETLLANQLAAEVATLREAVVTVREAAHALAAAVDPAEQPMLRLTLRETRDLLARRLEQLSPQCSAGVGSAAASEATLLLVELDAVL